MIVEHKPSWLHLVFTWRGSVLPKIWKRVLFSTVIGLVTCLWYQDHYFEHEAILTLVPFSLIGLALSIFLGFRNNTSYDRFWEGRKLWGRFVNNSRSFARQTLTFLETDDPSEQQDLQRLQRTIVYHNIAYIRCARLHLRNQLDRLPQEMDGLLSEQTIEELTQSSNAPVAILQRIGEDLHGARKKGWINTYHAPLLEQSLTTFTDIQGGCERIKKTPIPYSYTVLIHRIVGLYTVTLPFGVVHEVGYFTPLVAAMISYAFLALDAIGDEIEDPFGEDPNDLPLQALSTMIEVNLRESLGESDLPPMHKPNERNVLT